MSESVAPGFNLARLSELQDGWLGAGSLAPDRAMAERLSPIADRAGEWLSVMGDGGIQAEFEDDRHDYIVEFDRDGSVFRYGSHKKRDGRLSWCRTEPAGWSDEQALDWITNGLQPEDATEGPS